MGQDYIQPGTPRDSWGVASSAGNSWADYQFNGTSGILATIITVGVNSATAVSTLTSGMTLTQVYNFFAPNILSIQETLSNPTNSAITGIVFRRNVDLDIPPTAFNENVFGVLGSNAAVVANSYYGFENPNPGVAYTFPCGVSCNQTGDLGAGIDLGIGALAAGGSATFALLLRHQSAGSDARSVVPPGPGPRSQLPDWRAKPANGVYPALGAGSGFLGVSSLGTVAGPVPEPSTWAMMLLGFGAIGFSMRRRKRAGMLAAQAA